MEFKEIDMQGALRIERLEGSTPPVYVLANDEGRLIYLIDTGEMFWGSTSGWVEVNHSQTLLDHIASVSEHGLSSTDEIIGSTTLSEHTTASSAHSSNGDIVGTNDLQIIRDNLTSHSISPTAHYVNGNIIGSQSSEYVSTRLDLHIGDTGVDPTNPIHGASGEIAGLSDVTTAIATHISEGGNAHNLATINAAGFIRRLNGDSSSFIDGNGSWGPGPRGGSGSSGTSGTSGSSGTRGTNGTSGTNGSSGTSAVSCPSGSSGTSGTTSNISSIKMTSSTTSPTTSVSLTFTTGTYILVAFYTGRNYMTSNLTLSINGTEVDVKPVWTGDSQTTTVLFGCTEKIYNVSSGSATVTLVTGTLPTDSRHKLVLQAIGPL
jgi:hypothetical protein